MEEKIVKVLNVMSEYLSIAQMKKLHEVILQTFAENEAEKAEIANDKFLAFRDLIHIPCQTPARFPLHQKKPGRIYAQVFD